MSVHSVGPIRFAGVSQVTATLGVNDPEVGTIITEGDETYRFVYNAGNSAIAPGRGATVSGVSGYSVTVSSVAGDMCVGFCKHTTITTGTYGWLVVRGFVDGLTAPANSSIAAGAVLQLSTDGAVVASASAGGQVVAKAMAATASAGSCPGYVAVF